MSSLSLTRWADQSRGSFTCATSAAMGLIIRCGGCASEDRGLQLIAMENLYETNY